MRDCVLKHTQNFGQNLEQTRRKLMFSTWVQNNSSDKFGTDSQTFLEILRLFLIFSDISPNFSDENKISSDVFKIAWEEK